MYCYWSTHTPLLADPPSASDEILYRLEFRCRSKRRVYVQRINIGCRVFDYNRGFCIWTIMITIIGCDAYSPRFSLMLLNLESLGLHLLLPHCLCTTHKHRRCSDLRNRWSQMLLLQVCQTCMLDWGTKRERVGWEHHDDNAKVFRVQCVS